MDEVCWDEAENVVEMSYCPKAFFFFFSNFGFKNECLDLAHYSIINKYHNLFISSQCQQNCILLEPWLVCISMHTNVVNLYGCVDLTPSLYDEVPKYNVLTKRNTCNSPGYNQSWQFKI